MMVIMMMMADRRSEQRLGLHLTTRLRRLQTPTLGDRRASIEWGEGIPSPGSRFMQRRRLEEDHQPFRTPLGDKAHIQAVLGPSSTRSQHDHL